MRSYPHAARVFLALVWCLGLAAALAAVLCPRQPGESFPPVGVALAVVLAAAAGARKVDLIRSARHSEAGSMSLGFLITFAALLAFGVRAAVLIGCVSALSASLYPQRQPLPQLLFNVAGIIATAWLAGETFVILNGGIGPEVRLRSAGALLAATLVYFLLNTGGVSAIIALCSGTRLRTVWRQNFLWTAPSYFAGASCALVGQLLFRSEANLLLLAVPVLAFIHQSYRVYMQKEEQKQRYIAELENGRQMLANLYLSTVQSLASAIHAKDHNTSAHIQRVQRYSVAIAEKLGVEGDQLEAIKTGALLHDIGKLGVPDYVLLKPGPLSKDEFDKMKQHPEVGADILAPVPFPWPVIGAVRHHHERWDGRGYPSGLAGEDIPLGARILAVADVFDALTSERPYRAAWSQAQALEHLRQESGAQFDPAVVAAFLEIADEIVVVDSRDETAPQAARHIRRTGTELWAIYEIAQTLGSGLDLTERLEALCRKITAVIPRTTCAFLLPPARSDAEMEEDAAAEKTNMPARIASGAALRVWAAAGEGSDALHGARALPESASMRAMYTCCPYHGEFPADDLDPQAILPLRSALILPLGHLGEMLGTLNLYHPEPDAFGEDEVHLLTMIAGQVQSVLYHDILFDRTRSAAMTDPLTGLYNMRYLMQRTEPEPLSPATAEPLTQFSLLYLDLDHFKAVNDHFGHPKGNAVLQDIARLLRRELRPGDLVVRYGGDEFVIVLPKTNRLGAKQAAARIRAAVAGYAPDLRTAGGEALRLGVSIGIASCPADDRDINALVALADQRMYEEKIARQVGTSGPQQTERRPKPGRRVPSSDENLSAALTAQAVVHHPQESLPTGKSGAVGSG